MSDRIMESSTVVAVKTSITNRTENTIIVEPSVNLNEINFESGTHVNTILNGLNDLRLKESLFDVTLLAGGKSFQVNTNDIYVLCSNYYIYTIVFLGTQGDISIM